MRGRLNKKANREVLNKNIKNCDAVGRGLHMGAE